MSEALVHPTGMSLGWPKGLPWRPDGWSRATVTSAGLTLGMLPTPVMTIDGEALERNIAAFAEWCRARGVWHAPHGKTTMAPDIWRIQLDEGAWGVTVSNHAQLSVAVQAGVPRVMVANEIVDEAGARLLARAARREDGVWCWVDSVEGVRLLDAALTRLESRPVRVLIEVGVPGGRCGVRSVTEALAVAAEVSSSHTLRLGGLAAFEGVLGGERSKQNRAEVETLMARLAETHLRCRSRYAPGTAILSAGGSSWFDVVYTELTRACAEDPAVRVLLRSGGYAVQDHGYYQANSPSAEGGGPDLRPALRLWARLVSTPEPGLAYLDAGKRDLPYDEGLPIALARWRADEASVALSGGVTRTYDQHALLEANTDLLRVGDLIELGISHPCTAFDKWRALPLIAGDGPGARVVDVYPTFF